MTLRFRRFFAASLALLLLLIVILAGWAYQRARETAYALLREEGEALAEAIERSALHGLRTETLLGEQFLEGFQERVQQLDQELSASSSAEAEERIVRQAVERNQWDRALIFDRALQLKAVFPPWGDSEEGDARRGPEGERGPGRHGPMGMGRSMGMGAMGSGQRLQHFLESPERQWVLQGRGWHRMRGVEPLVIARKRPNGDVLVVRASLDRLRETVSPASVETLFRNLSLGKTIMTIALADDGGIIRIASDPRWHGRGVAEFDKGLRREQPDALLLDRPVETGDGTTPARLLLGLATASAERNLAQTRRGILLMGFTTLLVGVIGLAVIVRVQQRSLERVEALQRAVARSQRMASLGQMAGQVAHEIRNPLNAITLTVQNLRRQLDQWADRPASLATYFAATQQELARLNRIVEDFLKVSRFPEPKRQPIELNEWLRTFLPLYEAQAREQGIHLQLTGTAEPLTAPVDSDQFRQALGNVIANALQASPAGATIRVTVARSRAGVEITVQDEGKGIPSDLLERVFELYFTTRADGSGLGLPIAQRVMEEHGGSLTLDSRVGKGTIATLRLPLA